MPDSLSAFFVLVWCHVDVTIDSAHVKGLLG